MADFLDALRDPQFRADYLQGLKDAGNRSAAAFFGGPVDMATMVARPLGYDTPDRDVVGSSEWIGRKMEERGMVSEARNPVAEFLAALALPGGMAAAGTKLYAGEQALQRAGQQMAQNAMVPRTMNPQAGAIFFPGSSQMSLSIDDATEAAKRIKQLGPEFVPKIEEAHGGSVYLTVSKSPLTKNGMVAKRRNPYPINFKARFADHPGYWGSTISSDPVTGNTVEDVVQMFKSTIGKANEPDHTIARFSPADLYGTATDVRFVEGLSNTGRPTIKRITENRPFTFFDPDHPK